ncbi:hypothetical protein Gohar_003005, partial [Gossypium harknessii]|nr:hypothetical protein [Gossypium harknessii]
TENPLPSWTEALGKSEKESTHLGYLAFTVGTITGTPEIRHSWSSRTRERSSQCSNTHTRYGSTCLTTF